jgi:hypothetical protein
MKKWLYVLGIVSLISIVTISIFFIPKGRSYFKEKGVPFAFEYPRGRIVTLEWNDLGSAYNHRLFPKVFIAPNMAISVQPVSLSVEDMIIEGGNKGPPFIKKITVSGYPAAVFGSEYVVDGKIVKTQEVFFNAEGLSYNLHFKGEIDEGIIESFKVLK